MKKIAMFDNVLLLEEKGQYYLQYDAGMFTIVMILSQAITIAANMEIWSNKFYQSFQAESRLENEAAFLRAFSIGTRKYRGV